MTLAVNHNRAASRCGAARFFMGVLSDWALDTVRDVLSDVMSDTVWDVMSDVMSDTASIPLYRHSLFETSSIPPDKSRRAIHQKKRPSRRIGTAFGSAEDQLT